MRIFRCTASAILCLVAGACALDFDTPFAETNAGTGGALGGDGGVDAAAGSGAWAGSAGHDAEAGGSGTDDSGIVDGSAGTTGSDGAAGAGATAGSGGAGSGGDAGSAAAAGSGATAAAGGADGSGASGGAASNSVSRGTAAEAGTIDLCVIHDPTGNTPHAPRVCRQTATRSAPRALPTLSARQSSIAFSVALPTLVRASMPATRPTPTVNRTPARWRATTGARTCTARRSAPRWRARSQPAHAAAPPFCGWSPPLQRSPKRGATVGPLPIKRALVVRFYQVDGTNTKTRRREGFCCLDNLRSATVDWHRTVGGHRLVGRNIWHA